MSDLWVTVASALSRSSWLLQ